MAGRQSVRRFRRLALVTAALLLGASACSTSPGSAVVVGGHDVSEQSVLAGTQSFLAENSSVDLGNPPNLNALDQINRAQATAAIRHQLVEIAAADKHITVSDSGINSYISAGGGTAALATQFLVPASEVVGSVRDLLVLQKLAKDSGDAVTDVALTVDWLTVGSRDEAVAARERYLRDPAAMTADVAAAEASQQGQSAAPMSLLTDPGVAGAGLFDAAAGDIVIAPSTAPTYLVAKIVKRTVQQGKLPADALASTPSSSMSPADVLSLLSLSLLPYAQHDAVSVNPRYGVWDASSLQVVPGNSGL